MSRGVLAAAVVASLAPFPSSATAGQESGGAVVRVVTEPELTAGTLRFSGEPSGEITLAPDRPARLTASALGAGTYESTLGELDPEIRAAGYALAGISCDDGQSAAASSGDVATRRATFEVEAGETVTCVFRLTAGGCLCPREGRWSVRNHAGSMVCTGTMNMTLPLTASSGEGTLDVQGDGCSTIVASGMSDDEAPVTMREDGSCGFTGTAGGEEGGMPLTIHFTFAVESAERLTGSLSATVSEQGTTCEMSRTFELDYAN